VLFYSPTCGHCEYVINETLIPLVQKYGDQLQILALDVTQQEGQMFFQAAIQEFSLEQAGVPFLVIDDIYLIGSLDIPERFPGLVESYLAQGGLGWPAIPGLAGALATSGASVQPTATAAPIVRAVLFYRSACSHCQKLTEETIPPLLEKYGAQLEIFAVDASFPEGNAIYHAAIERFDIERIGVPILILGNQVLVGSGEIDERFAGIIEGYFAQGGLGWPAIPGLPEAMARAAEANIVTTASPTLSATPQATPEPPTLSPSSASETTAPVIPLPHNGPPDWRDLFARDPQGNTLSVLVLAGMLGSIGWAINLFRKKEFVSVAGNQGWLIPILCVVGFGVAAYLAYVETAQVEAACGPVGDCNTVQQSEYARLFGILPIGVLGMIGYLLILLSWWIGRLQNEAVAAWGKLTMLGLSLFGLLFSIYLTFLEPFVIGATCAWCVASAILMTVLFLLGVQETRNSISRLPTRFFFARRK
jgi:uncharacterized membrane protein/thiol-disulfide isomerase/thioredoxin